MKKLFFALIILMFYIFPQHIMANEKDYSIESYFVDIIVNENNSFDITEKITVLFHKPQHGIYRSIPLTNVINRLDGSYSKNKVQISNISVNTNYETYKDDDNLIIKIGSQDVNVIEKQNYVIKYNYSIGEDSIREYDEFYYNIVGSEWDTNITNISFNIKMPKKFDYNKVGFSYGNNSFINTDRVIYNLNENTINGYLTGKLYPKQALTIRIELPNGYFINNVFNINMSEFLMIVIPILFSIVSIFIWYKYDKDKHVIDTIEFYPPENLNSLEIGFLYKGKADSNDVVSLLIYLANKGYIKLSDFDEDNNFKITKIKDYEGDNIFEKKFLEGLFKSSKKIDLTEFHNLMNEVNENKKYITKEEAYKKLKDSTFISSVYSYQLKNKFYKTVNDILDIINDKENITKVFTPESINKKKILSLILIVTIFLIDLIPMIGNFKIDKFVSLLLLSFGVYFFVVFLTLLLKNKEFFKKNNKFSIIVSLGVVIFFGYNNFLSPLINYMETIFFFSNFNSIMYIIDIICIIIISLCLKFSIKRTDYSKKMVGKIEGFKKYIETVEKEKIQMIVEKNPNYCYDILPYAYALGISDDWIRKIEIINISPPPWYIHMHKPIFDDFGYFVNNILNSASDIMTSSPISNISSGGGLAGGGSGGGGGGSW